MSDRPICGANKPNGEVCKAAKGMGTSHPGSGRCKFHGGSSQNGNLFAARQQVMAMASEADAEPSEVLLKAIRCDWGAVLYVQDRLSNCNERIVDAEAEADYEALESAHKAMAMWQQTYGDWVDRAAKHSKLALDAGIQERQIKMMEETAVLLAQVVRGVLDGLDLSPAQRTKAPDLVRTHMLAIDTQVAS